MMSKPDDHDSLVPIPFGFRNKVTPEMVVPRHDFGPKVGVHDAIRPRELWLLLNISDEKMAEIDAARRAKGLKPMFADE